MLRRFPSRLFLAALPFAFAACAQTPEVLVAFRTEQQAQEHCPKDAVVWVDPQSASYYLNTSPSYGHAGTGRYACRRDAELAGMRAIAN
jgi:hypothetical protein